MSRMRTRNLVVISALVATGWITGCAGKSVSILVTRPAEISLGDYDRIAIGEIKSAGSGFVSKLDDFEKFLQGVESGDTWIRRFAAEMSQALAQSDQFEILDYKRLMAGRGGEDDIGNVVLISGGLLAYDYDEEDTSEDAKGEKINRKTKRLEYRRKGTAHVEVQLRVVDLQTSRILASSNFSGRKSIRTSGKTPAKASIDKADRRRLFAACRADIVQALKRMIVPYTERVLVSFETDKGMPELERGFRMVQLGNWDAAVAVFQETIRTYSNSPEIHKAYYDLGLSCMYLDRFDEARAALQEAYARKSSGKYRNAILELDRRKEEKRRLEEQTTIDQGTGENKKTETEQ